VKSELGVGGEGVGGERCAGSGGGWGRRGEGVEEGEEGTLWEGGGGGGWRQVGAGLDSRVAVAAGGDTSAVADAVVAAIETRHGAATVAAGGGAGVGMTYRGLSTVSPPVPGGTSDCGQRRPGYCHYPETAEPTRDRLGRDRSRARTAADRRWPKRRY